MALVKQDKDKSSASASGNCYNDSMWRNPISDKRYSHIVNYVRKQLEKHKKQELYQYRTRVPGSDEEHMEAQFEKQKRSRLEIIEPQLQYLGESDPTSSGQYCKWIVDLILRKNIVLPEDTQKVKELLEVYHKVKRRLPVEHREIKSFRSYHQLRTTLIPLLPKLKSVKELQREGMMLLHSDVINNSKYDIFKLMTAEAASKAAQNTGWCVCNITTAQSYLNTGPLYLIFRNDERFILAHMEVYHGHPEETIQVMDINDIPIHPKHPEHHYDEITALFADYLPQFLCKEHSKTLDLYPTIFETATIYNLRCEECEEDGCPQTIDLCEVTENSESCAVGICKEHRKTCAVCEILVCNDHSESCCMPGGHYGALSSNTYCPEHFQKCWACDSVMCDSCSNYVECCEEFVCENCIQYCSHCSATYCQSHGNFNDCDKCGEYQCEGCQEEWSHAECCNLNYCEHCSEKELIKCDVCEADWACPECKDLCGSCEKYLCENCREYCHDCNETYCEDCVGKTCDSCKEHSHEIYDCLECDEYQDLCLNCIMKCRDCGGALCEEHQIICSCVADVRRGKYLHAYCKKCYPKNFCPICDKTFCYPEEHMACAYTPRRKRQLRRR